MKADLTHPKFKVFTCLIFCQSVIPTFFVVNAYHIIQQRFSSYAILAFKLANEIHPVRMI